MEAINTFLRSRGTRFDFQFQLISQTTMWRMGGVGATPEARKKAIGGCLGP
jgi:hypothetical protein